MSKGSNQGINFRLLHLISSPEIFCDYKEVEESNCPQTDQAMSRYRTRIWGGMLLECKTDVLLYPHCFLTTLQNTGLEFASSALFSLPWARALLCLAQEQDMLYKSLQFSHPKIRHPVSGSWVCSPGSWWSGLTFSREPAAAKVRWGPPDPSSLQGVVLLITAPACCFGAKKWLKPYLWTKCRKKPHWAGERAHPGDWLFSFLKVVLGQNFQLSKKPISDLSFYHLVVKAFEVLKSGSTTASASWDCFSFTVLSPSFYPVVLA